MAVSAFCKLSWAADRSQSRGRIITNSFSDIKQYNVVLTCSNLSKASEEECLDFIGRPHVEKLKRVDDRPLAKGLPTHLIKSAEWVNWRALETEEIRLLDFGDCFWQGTPLPVKYQPRQFRTPELIFDSGFDERADLWRAGCMVSETIYQVHLPPQTR